MNDLKYKNYKAKIEFSAVDELLVGEVLDVDALILFSGASVQEITTEFHAAIDAYLADCEANNVEPEKPYKGSFNVRIGCEAHRKAAGLARAWNITLNEVVKISVEQVVDRYATGKSHPVLKQKVSSFVRDEYELPDVAPKVTVGPAYHC